MALTGQDILNAVNKAPVGQKVGVVAAVIVALTAANWYFFVDPMQTQINQRQATLRQLEDELIQTMVPSGSSGTRPVKLIDGKMLELEMLYPRAMFPALSMAMEPIQR